MLAPAEVVALESPLPTANLVLGLAALMSVPWLLRGAGWARLLGIVVAGAHVLAIGGVISHGVTGGVMSIATAEVDELVRWIVRPWRPSPPR